VNILADTGIRLAVAGGCTVYARGGPPSEHDVDIFIRRQDAAQASQVLQEAGITDALLDRATPMQVGAAFAPVVSGTDLMIDKPNVPDAHRCDFVRCSRSPAICANKSTGRRLATRPQTRHTRGHSSVSSTIWRSQRRSDPYSR